MEHLEKPDNGETKIVKGHQYNHDLIYQNLPEQLIRVLDLLPGSSQEPVQLDISVVPIESPGEYEALWYVWGNPKADLQTVMCHGVEFNVTANLFEGLTRFRETTETRRLWVDAICINQGSISERNQQVRMMGQIYQRAKKVLIWIGPENDEVDIQRAFRVEVTRINYGTQVHMLDHPKGSTALLLRVDDAEVLDMITDIRQRYQAPEPPDNWDLHPRKSLTRMISRQKKIPTGP
ncbi:heterokaryon incompatibility protein-domain-containing protein [Aspergillus floccosus]